MTLIFKSSQHSVIQDLRNLSVFICVFITHILKQMDCGALRHLISQERLRAVPCKCHFSALASWRCRDLCFTVRMDATCAWGCDVATCYIWEPRETFPTSFLSTSFSMSSAIVKFPIHMDFVFVLTVYRDCGTPGQQCIKHVDRPDGGRNIRSYHVHYSTCL
jgi:hypothetical protein